MPHPLFCKGAVLDFLSFDPKSQLLWNTRGTISIHARKGNDVRIECLERMPNNATFAICGLTGERVRGDRINGVLPKSSYGLTRKTTEREIKWEREI